MLDGKKMLFSGMQPTGNLTLGNYLGALNNWVALEDEYECLYCVVDMHSITVRQNPAELRKRARNLLALYIAAGLDPAKNCIYYQSHVSAHAELAWILNCYTYMGELSRMTQFKDKSEKHADNINAGLFTYPVLMAADILLYQTDIVPVGIDQKQHVELARDIAIRYNKKYGETFVVPEPIIKEVGTKIMDLQDPTKKMSKSDENPKAYISLLDDINVIKNKIKGALTDLDTQLKYDPENKPGISNLLTIYQAITNLEMKDIEEKFKDSNYQTFKEEVAKVVVNEIEPIQKRYNEILNSKELDEILDEGRDAAMKVGYKKISKVYQRIGLGRKQK